MSGTGKRQRTDATDCGDIERVSRRSFLGHSLGVVAGLSLLPTVLEACGRPGTATTSTAKRKVVIFVQENHTTDNYFASMARSERMWRQGGRQA